jgi:coenzyme F420-reducing hydrogenase gamma subunit
MKRAKPKVAFFDFAGCEGCQLTVIDALQTHLDLLEAVEITSFREASSAQGDGYQSAFVEGSITRRRDAERLGVIRKQADVLVALGACAHTGCVNALKNLQPLEDVRRTVYGDCAEWYDTYAARPVSAVVDVDAFVPGCPIDREEFVTVVSALLIGKKPPIPEYSVCVECKLKGNVCLFHIGKDCLGPVTRGGCGAICPTHGHGCQGCRGFIPHPNEHAMAEVLGEAGLSTDSIRGRLTMFNTCAMEREE